MNVVHHHLSRQVTLPHTGLARGGQNRFHLMEGKGLGNHPETNVITDPRTCGQLRRSTRHSVVLLSLSKTEYHKNVLK